MGAELGAAREADGVQYVVSDLAPGLRMFSCSRLAATLSTGGCEKRWREAQVQTPTKGRRSDGAGGDTGVDRFSACRGCPIGAAHAGEAVVSYSALYGMTVCPRCRKGVTRMIGGRICVSCYNREREVAVGKNARGTAPTKFAPLMTVQVRAVVDGAAITVRSKGAVDALEPMIQTMRTTPGKAVFAFNAPPIVRSDRHRASAAIRPARFVRPRPETGQGMLF